ncbi:MAG TPA: hypothetical protein VGB62_09320 [Allosphingosinicella sp.]|jgi:hypothetical protein
MSIRMIVTAAALCLATAAPAQSGYSPGRWKFGEGANGELAAEIWTEVGHGLQIHLAFQCNEGGRYSYIGSSGVEYPLSDELQKYVDSYTDGNRRVETYRAGVRTSSFEPTGFHKGNGDPVTDLQLRFVMDADFLLLIGAKRPIALPAENSKVAIAQYIAACGVLKSK